jgi:hypothetical protein
LRIKLAAAHPDIQWPAESTIGEVLKRTGLTHPRKLRVRTPPYAQPFASVEAANQTWCADFKGWFLTGDVTRCDPLTITDAHSRYLLRCHITPKADGAHVPAIFDASFRAFRLVQTGDMGDSCIRDIGNTLLKSDLCDALHALGVGREFLPHIDRNIGARSSGQFVNLSDAGERS